MSRLSDNIHSKFKDRDFIFKAALFAFYLIIHFILCFYHEPWRDEAQAFLIVRDLSIPDIIKQLTVEGHPFLWYLAMLLPVKLGLTAHYLSFVSFALCAVGTYVFIFKAPFKTYFKVPILLGMIFMYSLPIIARDYCLVGLLLPLIACYYGKRYKKPVIYGILIFLLLQVHVIMAGFAIMLILISLIEVLISSEKRKRFTNYLPAIIGILGVIVLILQLRAGSSLLDLNGGNIGVFLLGIFGNVFEFIISMFNGLTDAVMHFTDINSTPLCFAVAIFLLIGIAGNIALIKYYWRELLIMLGGIGAHIFIHEYIWAYIPQRTICTMFIYLIYVWMIWGNSNVEFKTEKTRMLAIIFKWYILAMVILLSVLSVPNAIKSISQDLTGNYSGAEEISKYIKEELPEDSVVISVTKDFYLTPIIAHYSTDDEVTWNPMRREYETTFVDWNNRGEFEITNGEIENQISEYFSEYDNIYILQAEGETLGYCDFSYLEPVFTQDGSFYAWGETYTIYKYSWVE